MSDLLDRRTDISTDRQTNTLLVRQQLQCLLRPLGGRWRGGWTSSLSRCSPSQPLPRGRLRGWGGRGCEWGREVNRGQRPWNVAQSNLCIVRTSAKLPTGVSVQQQNGVPVAEGRQDQTQEILVGDAEVGTLEERNHNHMGTLIFIFYLFLTV